MKSPLVLSSIMNVNPLDIYSTNLEGPDILDICSIRRPFFYVRKPKRRGKVKPPFDSVLMGELDESLFQNPNVTSLFAKGLSCDSGSASIDTDWDLRDASAPQPIPK